MSKFTFANIEEGFDNHIHNSIRGYSDLWNDVLAMSEYFVEDNTNVVDIGCSTGKLIKHMHNQNKFSTCHYHGIEVEPSFYKELIDEDRITYFKDTVKNFQFNNCSLITSIFTLQFIPQRDRETILKNIYDGLNKGGAFIFSEKVFSNNPRVQEMLTFLYYDYKRKHYSSDEILNKEAELRHLAKPSTEEEIISSCQTVGFTPHIFWRNYNFVGFVCIKE